ncbi:UTP--glucose-1-phosphate uridylyltransferase [Cohnella lubricantis]|uniref:UTP--glucose-1-phosphate uridylyltransferase n=1 Tax=Cohnella lubricantis TaxID=2163172 RepID=A0A841T7F6_9BACL|nr:hypothetical protein [Cohnella lubricantis]MBP2119412.1 UTP-glucose-1-phosphate uridylyltransferase [Cohnella lubricantis]
MNQHEATGSPVISVLPISDKETQRYGIVDPFSCDDRLYQVKLLMENPTPGYAPLNLAIMGRYIMTPEIFLYLDKQQVGAGGEIQLTDAILGGEP